MSKKLVAYHRSSTERTLDAARYMWNGYGCGHGAHVNKKRYNRRDKSWRKELS